MIRALGKILMITYAVPLPVLPIVILVRVGMFVPLVLLDTIKKQIIYAIHHALQELFPTLQQELVKLVQFSAIVVLLVVLALLVLRDTTRE